MGRKRKRYNVKVSRQSWKGSYSGSKKQAKAKARSQVSIRLKEDK